MYMGKARLISLSLMSQYTNTHIHTNIHIDGYSSIHIYTHIHSHIYTHIYTLTLLRIQLILQNHFRGKASELY